jgi:hypothetical protein
MSDGPTLESALQPRPPIQHMTERLPPGARLGAQVTMQMSPQNSSARVSTAPVQHLSSGSMPSAQPPPPQPMPMIASGSYPLPSSLAPVPPPERRAGRGAIIASAILLLAVLAAAVYLYLRGMPHLP